MTNVTNESTVSNVSILDSKIEAARKQMADLNTMRKALMPAMNNDALTLVVDFTKAINVSAEVSKLVSDIRKNSQQSDEQKDQIAAARLEHVKLINTPAVKAQAVEAIQKAYLKSFKLKHRTDGRTTVSISGQI